MRSPRALVLAVLLLVLVPGIALGAVDFQENVGFSPNHLFQAGTFGEHVDVTTGNLTLSVPIGPKFELRELSYQIVLTYNSKVWDYQKSADDGDTIQGKPYLKAGTTYGVGWTWHEGRLYLDDPSGATYPASNATYAAVIPQAYKAQQVVYEAPDGSRHTLYADRVPNDPYPLSDPLAQWFFSRDGSFLRARAFVIDEPGNPGSKMVVWKLWEPDGTSRVLGYLVGDGKVWDRDTWTWNGGMKPSDLMAGWYTIRRDSARGRVDPATDCETDAQPILAPGDLEFPCTYIEYFYGSAGAPEAVSLPQRASAFPGIRLVRDSIGREIEVIRSDNTLVSFLFPFLGRTVQYDLVLQEEGVQGHLNNGLYEEYPPGNCVERYPPIPADLWTSAPMLRQIRYPEGYEMSFSYDEPNCVRHGTLTRRTLPTGAISLYEYEYYPYGIDKDRSYSLTRRKLLVAGQPDAVWEYARAPWQTGDILEQAVSSYPTVPTIDTGQFLGYFIGGEEAMSFGLNPNQILPYEEPPTSAGGGLPELLTYSNPPRVFERDPDGNITVYHLYTNRHDPVVGEDDFRYPVPEYYGLPVLVETIRGPHASGEVEKFVKYSYRAGGLVELPYHSTPYNLLDDPDQTFLRHDVTRSTTRTLLVGSDGEYRYQVTRETDFDIYGHARTKTEYDISSAAAVYRTTHTNWLVHPNNPDVPSGAVLWNGAPIASVTPAPAVEMQWRWKLDIVTSTEVIAGGATVPAQLSRTTAFDRWGTPLETRDYPDPSDVGSYVRTLNTLDLAGHVTKTAVSNVGMLWPETVTTHFTRDAAGQLLYKEFGDPKLQWRAFDRDVDLASGLVTATRTPAGVLTTYERDDLGRLTRIVPGPGEHPTTITYPTLQLTTVDQGTTMDRIFANYRYDQAGRLIEEEKIADDGTLNRRTTEYDVAGRVVFVSEWVPAATSGELPGTRTEYWVPLIGTRGPVDVNANPPIPYTADPLGRVTRVRTADGAVVETTYDGLKRTVTVKDLNRVPGSGVSTGPGIPTSTTTTFTNDAFGRLIHVDAPDGGEDAVYRYDVLDNLVRVEMGTQVREFQYDALGRLRLTSNPENGTVTYGQYGPTGLLKQQTDAAGVETFWRHDAAGRVLEESTSTGQTIRGYVYDTPQGGSPPGGGVNRSAGRLVLVGRQAPNGTLEVQRVLIYAGLNGRLSEEQTRFDDAGTLGVYSTGYSYNAFGLPLEVRYPERLPLTGEALVARSGYLHGHLRQLGDATEPQRFVAEVLYNAAGAPERVQMGNDAWTVTDHDLRNRPGRIRALAQTDTVAGDHLETVPESASRLAGAGPGAWEAWLRSRPLAPASDDGAARPRLPVDLLALSQGIEIDPGEGGSGGSGGGEPPPALAWDSGLYSYDGAGNIIAIGDDRFAYDAHGRLAAARLEHLPGPGAGVAELTWLYDSYGNMLEHTRDAGGSTLRHTFVVDDTVGGLAVGTSNHIRTLDVDLDGDPLSSRTFAYDAVGNMTSDGQRDLLWDALGRLREVRHMDGTTLGRYGYDDRDHRARKVEDGFETFYIRDTEGRVLSEFRRPEGSVQPPAWDQDYVYALGGAIATVKNDAPEAPRDLRAAWSNVGEGVIQIVLHWTKDTEPDIEGYRVYRRSYPGTGSFEPRHLLDGRSVAQGVATDPVVFTDPNNPEEGFEYYVTTVDAAGHESAPSRHMAVSYSAGTSSIYTHWTTLPPILAGDESLELNWNVLGDAALLVNGYRVHRKGPGDADFLPLQPAGELLETTTYTDVGLMNGELYHYKVTAAHTNGSEPEVTDALVVAASGMPQDLVPPGPPPTVKVSRGRGSGELIVSWTPSNAHDLVGYRLYDVSGATPVLVGNDRPVSPRVIKLTGLGSSSTRHYALTAFDDAANESAPSPSAMATTWGVGTSAYLDTDPQLRKIYEWGTPRFVPEYQNRLTFHWQSNVFPYQDYYEYGWPVLYRGAELYLVPNWLHCNGYETCKPYEYGSNPGMFLGYNVYRSSCPDPVTLEIPGEVTLRTPEPILDDWDDSGDALFIDMEPQELCHLYYITTVGLVGGQVVESGPLQEDGQNGVMYTWAYAPNEVMGQYAYGAKLGIQGFSQGGDSEIAIVPEGGWELGSSLPGDPVVLRWRKSFHPEVVGYRLWVRDRYRCPPGVPHTVCNGSTWQRMADVSREVTSYLDYDAPLGWPVLCTDSGCNVWQDNSCHVWSGDDLDLQACPCSPGTKVVAEYYVEGLTAGSPEPTQATLSPNFNEWDKWGRAVRAIGLSPDPCPTGPGQEFYDPYCNGNWAAYNPPYDENCDHVEPEGGLSLPESPLPASPEFAEPELVAEAGPSRDAGPIAGRPVLGGLTVMTQWNVEFPRAENGPELAAAASSPARPSAPDRLVGQLSPATTTHWLHVDHLGSTRVVTDATGAVVSKHKYLPFGEEYGSFGAPAVNSHKFTGHERDEETGLDYMMARYYGNNLGRFLSTDPADDSVTISDPQSWNRYSYAASSPIRYVDPDGMHTAGPHDEMSQALQDRMSPEALSEVVEGNLGTDHEPGTWSTRAEHTNKHSMAGVKPDGAYQTTMEAAAGSQAFVDASIDDAVSKVFGGDVSGARNEFGRAVHTVQDSTSASHENFAQWRGVNGTPLSMTAVAVHGLSDAVLTKNEAAAGMTNTRALHDKMVSSIRTEGLRRGLDDKAIGAAISSFNGRP